MSFQEKNLIRLSDIASDQYDRQKRIPNWDQGALEESTVLVIGAGALGNETCKNLAQCGIGSLIVVDYDNIEPSNLNRCVFFQLDDVGKSKCSVLVDQISQRFPKVNVKGHISKCEELEGHIFSAADVVVSCVDNIDTRLTINRHVAFYHKPLIDGGTSGMNGRVQTILPLNSACLDCRWRYQARELALQKHRCAGEVEVFQQIEPALGITTSIVSAVQANEVVKMIKYLKSYRQSKNQFESIIGSSLVNKMWVADLDANQFFVNTVQRDPECPYHE